MIQARIHVFFKDSVFDPQGNTVQQSLTRLGFSRVKNVRIGKAIDITLDTNSEEQAIIEIKKMCDKLLVNPVIESFRYELKAV